MGEQSVIKECMLCEFRDTCTKDFNWRSNAVYCESYMPILGKMIKEKEVDNVNHPAHYCQEGAMECIDEMILIFGEEATMNFCLLNAWKYRKRAVYKNGEEDIKKSDWYLKKYKELKSGDN